MEITAKDVIQFVSMLGMLGSAVVAITRQIMDLKASIKISTTETQGEMKRMADALDTLKEAMQGQQGKVAALEVEVRDLREWKARVEQLLVGLRESGRL